MKQTWVGKDPQDWTPGDWENLRSFYHQKVYRESVCTVCNFQDVGAYLPSDHLADIKEFWCPNCQDETPFAWGLATWTKLDRSDIDVLL